MIEQTQEGWWIISRDDYIGRWVKESRRLDIDDGMLPYLLPHIRPGSNVIDVGAYIGDHTIAYLRAVGEGKVYAFEPAPEAFACLSRNCPQAICSNKALSALAGELVLNIPRADPRTATFLQPHIPDSDAVSVQVSTLDRELPDLDDVSLIKLDCEGFENQVLLGGVELISRCLPVIEIELNAYSNLRPLTGPVIRETLGKLNYHAVFEPGRDWSTDAAEIFCFPR